MTTAVLIAKSMQKEGSLPTKNVIYHCGKKPRSSWRKCLLWSPQKGNIISVLHLGHMVFGTQRQYVKESFCCLMFSLTPVRKQWRSRASKPLGSVIIALCHSGASDRSALLVQFCPAASGTDAAPPGLAQSHTAASSAGAVQVGPFWSLSSV